MLPNGPKKPYQMTYKFKFLTIQELEKISNIPEFSYSVQIQETLYILY